MKNPIETINNVILSKDEISKLSDNITAGVRAGIEDPTNVIVRIEFLKKALEAAKKALLEEAIDELDKYGKDGATINGVKIRTKEAGVQYDYSNCEVWNELNEEFVRVQKDRKDLEARLKTVKGTEQILIPDGEIVDLVPPIKTSTTTVEVTFPK